MKPRDGKTKHRAEFGDFQTPLDFARSVCRLIAERGLRPSSVLEPTCGCGSFLTAALEQFPTVAKAVGIEIDRDSVAAAREALAGLRNGHRAEVRQEDFFRADWSGMADVLPEPLLIIGNPPWVTNSDLGTMGGSNLPRKSNFLNHKGIDAITGKANFDISEWILMKCLDWMEGRRAVLAMLCKTAVARRVLLRCWETGTRTGRADMFLIDGMKVFGAAVASCLLVIDPMVADTGLLCRVYQGLDKTEPFSCCGYHDDSLIADVGLYTRWKHLAGTGRRTWRSGIKHDCVRVMEFVEEPGGFRNRMGEVVHLEPDYLYPMLKSSDLANGRTGIPRRRMLVTQRSAGADTCEIEERAPKTWEYLCRHGKLLDRRASAVYRKRPRFSIFGVGDYSFAPWKVAVSGLSKNLAFTVVGPFEGKPVVLDDTCYFLACRSHHEAEFLARLLNSTPTREFYSAFVFWDAKRPITAEILRRLDLLAPARELGIEEGPLNDLESPPEFRNSPR